MADEKDGATPKDFRILERIAYPNWNVSNMNHDIALFKLETDVQFNAFIRPVCL